MIKLLRNFFMIDTISGMMSVLKNLFRKNVTINFPNEKAAYSKKFRGEHALRRYVSETAGTDGEERCIGCKLCEVICPAQAITIINNKETAEMKRSTAEYYIDMTKCIYCGLCEEACPVSAIVETNNAEYAAEDRAILIYNKNKLLNNGKVWENSLTK